MKDVVVTGMGVVSPLGPNLITTWRNLKNGVSGIKPIRQIPVDALPVRIAGEITSKDVDENNGFDFDYLSKKEQRRMDRFILFAIAAADQAVRQAGLEDERAIKENTGTIIASGIGGLHIISAAAVVTATNPPSKISPFTVPGFLANLAAGQVSNRHGLKGPLGCPVTACAASAQAIGDAARIIRAGEASVMLAGGSEACISRLGILGFAAMKALSTRNDAPQQASRPFDKDRDGFVMGEGAAVLVLEERDHALARGAHILATLKGYGTSADAYHMSAPPADGEGAARAMRIALKQAGLAPQDIGYLNAHATSTPVGDHAELNAVRSVFETRASRLPISSTKSATGHLLGGAGALEAAIAIMALNEGVLPPTLNFEEADEEFSELNFIPEKAIEQHCDFVMSNASGFGGVNASLIFGR